MTEPRVFDARRGLPTEALAELKQADRITVAMRNGTTAALGSWARPPGTDALELRGVILLERDRAARARSGDPAADAEFRLVLEIQPRDNQHWERLLGALRPGDVLYLGRNPRLGTDQLEVWLENRPFIAFDLWSFKPRKRRGAQ